MFSRVSPNPIWQWPNNKRGSLETDIYTGRPPRELEEGHLQSYTKEPGKDLFLRTLSSTQPCWYLSCGLPASQTRDNKSLLFKPLGLQCFVRVALGRQHTALKSLLSPFPSSAPREEVAEWCSQLSSTSLCECVWSLSRVWLYGPMDCNLPGSSVHELFQARILEGIAISYSRGSSWPRDRTHVSCVSFIGR